MAHFTSNAHRSALYKLDNLAQKNKHVDNFLSSLCREAAANAEQIRLRNREIINMLLDCTRYLSRQGLAFRGRESDSGNYIQLIRLMARWIPTLKNWIDDNHLRPYHANYLSNKSQNEFIGVLGSCVREKIVANVENCGFFSVMADSTPDLSHLDQLSIVIRYVTQKFQAEERLLKLKDCLDKTGEGMAKLITEILQSVGISLSQARAQSYDTTSSMSGRILGCQTKLSEIAGRTILYIPCLAHKVNLCVEHACEESNIIKLFYDSIQDLYNFFSLSTKRFSILREKMEVLQKSLTLKSLSKTRWIMRVDSVRAVLSTYDALIHTLQIISEDMKVDKDARAKAAGLRSKMMSYDFIVSLLAMKTIMFKTKLATEQLQREDLNILEGTDIMQKTCESIQKLRNDGAAAIMNILKEADNICETHGINQDYEFNLRHRRRRPPSKIDENPETAVLFTRENYFKAEILKVVDRLTTAFGDIHKLVFEKVKPLTCLLPSRMKYSSTEDIFKLCQLFPDDLKDIDNLECEIDLMSSETASSESDTIGAAAQKLVGKAHLYPNLSLAYKLALIIPVTVTSNERSFSRLKIVKNYLRTTMSEERLDELMLLTCEADITDTLDLDSVAGKWAILKDRRVII